MKVCEYCGGAVEESAVECPHCSSASFRYKCDRCGLVHDGMSCPACMESDRQERELEIRYQREATASQRANRGLAWKVVLTVIMPYIGGYFTIVPHARKGVRVFGIFWCVLIALVVASGDGDVGGRILAMLLCLAPIGVYLVRMRIDRGSAA